MRNLTIALCLCATIACGAVNYLPATNQGAYVAFGDFWVWQESAGGVTPWTDTNENAIIFYLDEVQNIQAVIPKFGVASKIDLMSAFPQFTAPWKGPNLMDLVQFRDHYLRETNTLPQAMGTTTNLTIGGWYGHHNNVGGRQGFAGFGTLAALHGEAAMQYNDSSEVGFYVNNANGTIAEALWTDTPLDTPHHLMGTYDGLNLRLYIDGILQATTPQTALLDFTTNTMKYYVGAWYDTRRTLNGSIGPQWAYRRTLSSNEVFSLASVPYTSAVYDTVSTNELLTFYDLETNTWGWANADTNNTLQYGAHPTAGTGPTSEIGYTNAYGDVVRVVRTTVTSVLYSREQGIPSPSTNDFMYGIWFNLDFTNAVNSVMGLADVSGDNAGVSILENGQVKIRLVDGVTIINIVGPLGEVTPDQWHSLFVSRDYGVETTYYLDGIKASTSVVETLSIDTATDDKVIGYQRNATGSGRYTRQSWYPYVRPSVIADVQANTFPGVGDAELRIRKAIP